MVSRLFFILHIMKILEQLFFFTLSIIVITSCDRGSEMPDETETSGIETIKPYLKVLGEKSIQLAYDGGNENVWIESNTEWVCAISGPSELGLQIDKTKGYGDDVIIVTYANTRNETYYNQLNGYLTIRWTDSYGNKHSENVTFYRCKNPSWW